MQTMTQDKLICFRAAEDKIVNLDEIAERHNRSRSSLLQTAIDAFLQLDARGQLEEFLLQSAKKDSETT